MMDGQREAFAYQFNYRHFIFRLLTLPSADLPEVLSGLSVKLETTFQEYVSCLLLPWLVPLTTSNTNRLTLMT